MVANGVVAGTGPRLGIFRPTRLSETVDVQAGSVVSCRVSVTNVSHDFALQEPAFHYPESASTERRHAPGLVCHTPDHASGFDRATPKLESGSFVADKFVDEHDDASLLLEMVVGWVRRLESEAIWLVLGFSWLWRMGNL